MYFFSDNFMDEEGTVKQWYYSYAGLHVDLCFDGNKQAKRKNVQTSMHLLADSILFIDIVFFELHKRWRLEFLFYIAQQELQLHSFCGVWHIKFKKCM